MLWACVLDLKGGWEEHLPLVEFAYNNSYQVSIQMAPYEALYGRPCRFPICRTEVGERSTTSSYLIRDTSETVDLIWKHFLTVQSWQKSYIDRWRRPLEFVYTHRRVFVGCFREIGKVLDPRSCVKSGKNSIFLKKGKTIICCYSIGGKSEIFLDLG